jgi:F-type H+-transporting ATPase subunit b
VAAVVTLRGGQLASVRLSATDPVAKQCTSSDKFNNPSECISKEPNPVLPEMREIVWGLGSFLLLLVLIRWVAYPRLAAGTAARNAKIQGDLDAADQVRGSVGVEREAYLARITSARAEATKIIDVARGEVEGVRGERLAALNAELATLRAQATAEIEASRTAALASVRETVGDLAVEVAERVVARPIDRAAQSALIDSYVTNAGLN